jgi:hypothetical protein
MNLYANRHLNEIRSGGLPIFKRKVKSFLTYFLIGKVKKLLRRHAAKKVASAVRREIKEKSRIVVVYDHLTSCLAYGEFIYTLMLVRFFLVHELEVVLYIVDGQYRSDFAELVNTRCAQFLSEQLDLAYFVTEGYKDSFRCEKIGWEVASNLIQEIKLDKLTSIFLEEDVFQRSPIYHKILNILNYLVFSMNRDLLPRFLLNRKEFEGSLGQIASILPHPYILFNVRYNPDWGIDRNTSPELFVNVLGKLRVNYPECRIIVASDQLGCDYFKKVAEDQDIDCLFSKHLGLPSGLISDVLLILASKKYFQINGGGLGSFALFSSIPYEIIASPANELMWTNNTIVSWQFSNQVVKPFFHRNSDASVLDCNPV